MGVGKGGDDRESRKDCLEKTEKSECVSQESKRVEGHVECP